MTTDLTSPTCYDRSRLNALRHGVLSRHTVLPWEDAAEYQSLLAALVEEHQPSGPTEEHLVEELAGVIWRKRRLRLAEAASQRRRLMEALSWPQDTVRAALAARGAHADNEDIAQAVIGSDAEAAEAIVHSEELSAAIGGAIDLLTDQGDKGFPAALALLPDETKEWWEEERGDKAKRPRRGSDDTAKAAPPLLDFLTQHVMPWLKKYRAQLANQPALRAQAFGEAVHIRTHEQLSRYEVHLDRKLERMLAMLFRLKDLRVGEPREV